MGTIHIFIGHLMTVTFNGKFEDMKASLASTAEEAFISISNELDSFPDACLETVINSIKTQLAIMKSMSSKEVVAYARLPEMASEYKIFPTQAVTSFVNETMFPFFKFTVKGLLPADIAHTYDVEYTLEMLEDSPPVTN